MCASGFTCMVLSSILDTYQIGHDLLICCSLHFFTCCIMYSSVTGCKNIVSSILSGKKCVKLSLLLGILFASDGPIFTKNFLKPLAIVLNPVIFD